MRECTKRELCGKKVSMRLLAKTAPFLLILSLTVTGLFAGSSQYSDSTRRQEDLEGDRQEDFYFSKMKGFLGFRIGRFFPEAKGELFDFVTDELTLEKNDFRAWNLSFDGGFSMNNRVEIVFSVEYMKRTKYSEFREWVDEGGLPITQKTYYSQLPMTAGVKLLILPRMRQVGRYAFIPSRFVPYVGAGGGTLWYRFGQSGDFVDADTLEIFSAHLKSSGWTATGYLGGGLDINIARHTYLTLDVRYKWTRPELGGDYIGFDTLRMDGLCTSAGLQWHF